MSRRLGHLRDNKQRLLEILADNFLVSQNVIEQVGIGLAFAHCETFIEVVRGNDSREGQDERKTVGATQFAGVHFLALQHIDRNTETGWGNAWVIRNRDAVEVRVERQRFLPELKILA